MLFLCYIGHILHVFHFVSISALYSQYAHYFFSKLHFRFQFYSFDHTFLSYHNSCLPSRYAHHISFLACSLSECGVSAVDANKTPAHRLFYVSRVAKLHFKLTVLVIITYEWLFYLIVIIMILYYPCPGIWGCQSLDIL